MASHEVLQETNQSQQSSHLDSSRQKLFEDAFDQHTDSKNAGTYKVKPGDTMSSIGTACGVPYLTIIDLNPNVEPRRMSIGQELTMPPGTSCPLDSSGGGSTQQVQENASTAAPDANQKIQITATEKPVQTKLESVAAIAKDSVAEDFTTRLMHAIYGVEAPFNGMTHNQYYAANGALAGDGMMQVGVCQWYQKGEMHNLLSHWNAAEPAKFQEYFGDYSAKMINPDGTANIGFITTNNFWDLAGMPERMQNALNDPEFQKVQVQLLAAKANDAAAFASQYGIKSEFGVALLFQIMNQRGYGGAQQDLNATNVKARIASGEAELAVLQDFNSFSSRPNFAKTWTFLLAQFNSDASATK